MFQLRSILLALFLIIVPVFFLQAECASLAQRVAIVPPATWSGDLSNSGNGNALTITGVYPGDFKENQAVSTVWGTYSNKLQVRGQNNGHYTVSIRLDNDLISGVDRIPAANIRCIFTYAGGAYTGGTAADAIGTKYHFASYFPLSMSWTDIYYSGNPIIESPSADVATAEREFQFKYAVQVPDNTPPGVYTANIEIRALDDSAFGATRTAQISVTVGQFFRLSVDRGIIDFEKLRPGDTKDNTPVEGIVLTSKSNIGNPWFLKISNDNPLSSGPYIIPNNNLIWYGWTDGAGAWYGRGTDSMSPMPMLMYASAATEGNNLPKGTNNHLKFKITIPNGQQSGRYTTTVKLTMTE
jgi:hypothetical protein